MESPKSVTPEEVLSYWFPEGIDDADPDGVARRRKGRDGR